GVAPEGDWQQVSIFLSAFDVHVNRAPYGGRVTEVSSRPGRWLAAYRHESAHLNERSDITVEQEVDGELRRVHFRQVVGLMARRVVTRVTVGEEITTGQRIGLMKFGSRMDVFVPLECDLLVAADERVVAGETLLARWPASAGATTAVTR
ncbi:MAG: phosphatidylserine decarboxylase, partial [Phycicoccus sp.]